ncbi:DUF5330 domain-containing protein [Stappia sp. F7233]|uniref:DUF5330 domain-containing protein n=1 Tax=Stappia albiluteola TaxID=2758565 RepID=A0A839AGR1_9HYPH|nr:DUF5330 domain-containing protein [Stappia albiluteola]MBA5779050.1 DUF5330 domain-containing protein [Stappia albiluteola]
MFFLLRTAFWIGLVILLLPIDTGDNGDSSASISPVEAFVAAQSTVSDISGFCSRNPATCQTGGQALQAFGAKARESARLVYEYLDSATTEPTGQQASSGQGTLSASDFEAEWIAPESLELPTITGSIAVEPAPQAGLEKAPSSEAVALPTPKPANRERKA